MTDWELDIGKILSECGETDLIPDKFWAWMEEQMEFLMWMHKTFPPPEGYEGV